MPWRTVVRNGGDAEKLRCSTTNTKPVAPAIERAPSLARQPDVVTEDAANPEASARPKAAI